MSKILKPGTILSEGKNKVVVIGTGIDPFSKLPIYFCCLDRKGAALYGQFRGTVNKLKKIGFKKLDPKRRKALISDLTAAWDARILNLEVR